MKCLLFTLIHWKATLVANTRRTVTDDDREDNGWIWWEEKRTLRTSLPTITYISSRTQILQDDSRLHSDGTQRGNAATRAHFIKQHGWVS